MNKSIAKVFLVLVALFVSVWVFNHVNAWAGIAIVVAFFVWATEKVKKKQSDLSKKLDAIKKEQSDYLKKIKLSKNEKK